MVACMIRDWKLKHLQSWAWWEVIAMVPEITGKKSRKLKLCIIMHKYAKYAFFQKCQSKGGSRVRPYRKRENLHVGVTSSQFQGQHGKTISEVLHSNDVMESEYDCPCKNLESF